MVEIENLLMVLLLSSVIFIAGYYLIKRRMLQRLLLARNKKARYYWLLTLTTSMLGFLSAGLIEGVISSMSLQTYALYEQGLFPIWIPEIIFYMAGIGLLTAIAVTLLFRLRMMK